MPSWAAEADTARPPFEPPSKFIVRLLYMLSECEGWRKGRRRRGRAGANRAGREEAERAGREEGGIERPNIMKRARGERPSPLQARRHGQTEQTEECTDRSLTICVAPVPQGEVDGSFQNISTCTRACVRVDCCRSGTGSLQIMNIAVRTKSRCCYVRDQGG